MKPKCIAALAAVFVCALGTTASAQVERSIRSSEGDTHIFVDDPLHSGVSVPGSMIIKVRPGAARSTLIRPRTSFVPEMIKSVEKI
jgi:TctA family transporter